MKEFLTKYWSDIVAIIDKIYAAFKAFMLKEDAAE